MFLRDYHKVPSWSITEFTEDFQVFGLGVFCSRTGSVTADGARTLVRSKLRPRKEAANQGRSSVAAD